MKPLSPIFKCWIGLGVLLIAALVCAAEPASQPVGSTLPADTIQVALIDHLGDKPGQDKRSKCVDPTFLAVVDRESTIRVERTFSHVQLANDKELLGFPFIFFNGEGSFTLTDPERKNLKAYLARGGFLLASTRCANDDWTTSFRKEMTLMFPDSPLKVTEFSHPIFHALYDIDVLRTRQTTDTPVRLERIELSGRVAVVFSSTGLNGTDEVGGDCCCCGGNEIRDAKRLNANILVYALTH